MEGNNTFICELCHPDTDPCKRYSGFEVINTDINRFNCFNCDYDVCGKCVAKNEEKKAPPLYKNYP